MIKTEELMLGNFVYDEVFGEVEVISISQPSVIIRYKNLKENGEIEYNSLEKTLADIEPILLDKNIISRCSFCFDKDNFYDLHICQYKDFWFIIGDKGKRVKYLHELQNIYKFFIGENLIFK